MSRMPTLVKISDLIDASLPDGGTIPNFGGIFEVVTAGVVTSR